MIKTEVIKALESTKGSPVSGEALAQKLGVSRTAIWKAINNLKKDGYPIDTINGKGYVLSQECDKISVEGILNHLNTPADVLVFKEVQSTNTTAMGIANSGQDSPLIVVAESQTNGKGRRGRDFYSPMDQGIYMSILFKPEMSIDKSMLITTAASVAVMRAISSLTGKDVKIKWVNDLYIDGKKVCGILTEAVTDFESGQISHLVVGIGINCTNDIFPEELENIACALNFDGLERNKLIAAITDNLFDIVDEIKSGENEFLDDYRAASMVIGKKINVYRATSVNSSDYIEAEAIDINNNGGLVIKLIDGTIDTLSTGEVTIRTI